MVFEQSEHNQLLLDTSFIILAATNAYLAATFTERSKIVGHYLFEIFPDNPSFNAADGVENLRSSLIHVLNQRQPHRMPVQRYDVPRAPGQGGGFEVRSWRPINAPILGEDGFVRYIVHEVEDVTGRA